MSETRAQVIRRAALQMQADAEAVTPEPWWSAVARWLEASAESAGRVEAEGGYVHPDSHAYRVACAYLGEEPA